MRFQKLLVPALAVGVAASLAACQSSQDKNAELAKHGATALKQAPGLQLGGTSPVKVVDSAVVSGKDSSAVVVTLKNEGSQPLVDLPIAINVLDAKGKKVFTNTTPGLQKALQSMPVLEAGQTADWVNDQILTSTPPKSVKVTVGGTKNTTVDSKIDPTALTVSKPKLSLSSAIGPEANGTLVNKSSTELDQVLLFAVARKGGKVVAAGRGGVKKVRTGGKPANYHIFFKGDPRGADITVTAFPNKLE